MQKEQVSDAKYLWPEPFLESFDRSPPKCQEWLGLQHNSKCIILGDYDSMKWLRWGSYLKHLTSDALSLPVWPYDAIFVDEARGAQGFDVLRRLRRPKTDAKIPHGNPHLGPNAWLDVILYLIVILLKCLQKYIEKNGEKEEQPLDALKGAAGHVDDASGGPGDGTHQTFPDSFEEACCSLLLCSCVMTSPHN